ncbi:hypothetical protein H6P81_020751 [Aristolochia fimbriata]|uniref:Uncharacterized protein n=1 Tax=Aristolochia fimbriata TaxID=158543 RepID=A0AAV7DWG0_ARIFI|nr:hypothetical protein H6P81_020751 [Aristolochia fimbriata]
MGTDDDRGDGVRLFKFVMEADFERFLENLMRQMNERREEKATCVIADVCCSAALSVAKKMGIPGFGFSPAAVANLALCLHIPKLVESGFIADDTGDIVEDQMFRITPTMPEMSTSYFGLNGLSASSKRTVFRLMEEVRRVPTLTDRILCNSFRGIESPALDSIPQSSTNRSSASPQTRSDKARASLLGRGFLLLNLARSTTRSLCHLRFFRKLLRSESSTIRRARSRIRAIRSPVLVGRST